MLLINLKLAIFIHLVAEFHVYFYDSLKHFENTYFY